MSKFLCNDIHSKLNPTWVARIIQPTTEAEVVEAIHEAAKQDLPISICGARHAMGGQQFGEGTLLLDLSNLTAFGNLDCDRGTVEVEAGMQWPELIEGLHQVQVGKQQVWSIRQKQTGADNLTLGGALAANIHGRGLQMKPLIDDIEWFRLVDSEGVIRHCSREENSELFGLAIGGYGCFGVVTSICLRLTLRSKLERIVEITSIEQLLPSLEQKMREGHLYGDFQFSIDESSPDFLKLGVLSSYRPVSQDRDMPAVREELGEKDWMRLIRLAHEDRKQIFKEYSSFYLKTHGALYWSDTHQLSVYLDDYHETIDQECGAKFPSSEMISELYVPKEHLVSFMTDAADLLRNGTVPAIYGTVRFIQKDRESFLTWAQQDFACIIFNLHTEHSDTGIDLASSAFRKLIDIALSYGGTYFLTYHRWARPDQIKSAYPRFSAFLKAKDRYDPNHRFQSEWWRHHSKILGEG
ncbi:MAG: FAD-binding protein [Akkermansiaceae bacterium]